MPTVKSNTVKITVLPPVTPPPTEAYSLTLETDKTSYTAGETITLAGMLTLLTTPQTPIPYATITLYTVNPTGRVMQTVTKTDGEGMYVFTITAPSVTASMTVEFQTDAAW